MSAPINDEEFDPYTSMARKVDLHANPETRGVTMILLRELQAEYHADDLPVEPRMLAWSEAQARYFFEHAVEPPSSPDRYRGMRSAQVQALSRVSGLTIVPPEPGSPDATAQLSLSPRSSDAADQLSPSPQSPAAAPRAAGPRAH